MCPRCDKKCDYFPLHDTCGYSRVCMDNNTLSLITSLRNVIIFLCMIRVDIRGYVWITTLCL